VLEPDPHEPDGVQYRLRIHNLGKLPITNVVIGISTPYVHIQDELLRLTPTVVRPGNTLEVPIFMLPGVASAPFVLTVISYSVPSLGLWNDFVAEYRFVIPNLIRTRIELYPTSLKRREDTTVTSPVTKIVKAFGKSEGTVLAVIPDGRSDGSANRIVITTDRRSFIFDSMAHRVKFITQGSLFAWQGPAVGEPTEQETHIIALTWDDFKPERSRLAVDGLIVGASR